MEPHCVGRDRKCSMMINTNMMMMAIDVQIALIRKHMIIQPIRPNSDVCQLKYLNVGLKHRSKYLNVGLDTKKQVLKCMPETLEYLNVCLKHRSRYLNIGLKHKCQYLKEGLKHRCKYLNVKALSFPSNKAGSVRTLSHTIIQTSLQV